MKPIQEFTIGDLHERLQGLAKCGFISEGKFFIPSDVEEAFWEAHDEAQRRGSMPKLEIEDLIQPDDPVPIFHSTKIVRYSKRRYLDAFRSGTVFFGSAQSYATLPNKAQRDDELHRSWHGPNRTILIGETPYPASNIVFKQPIKQRNGDFTHYHSIFFSSEESAKLQRAFDAEGYVLIHDYSEFYGIISEKLSEFVPALNWGSSWVKYYDDKINPSFTKITDIVFSKSLSYRFQREARLVVFNAPDPTSGFTIKVTWPPGLISEIHEFKN